MEQDKKMRCNEVIFNLQVTHMNKALSFLILLKLERSIVRML